jgi:hypothetical protein
VLVTFNLCSAQIYRLSLQFVLADCLVRLFENGLVEPERKEELEAALKEAVKEITETKKSTSAVEQKVDDVTKDAADSGGDDDDEAANGSGASNSGESAKQDEEEKPSVDILGTRIPYQVRIAEHILALRFISQWDDYT